MEKEDSRLKIRNCDIIDYIRDEKVVHLTNSYGYDGDVIFKIRDCPEHYDYLDE